MPGSVSDSETEDEIDQDLSSQPTIPCSTPRSTSSPHPSKARVKQTGIRSKPKLTAQSSTTTKSKQSSPHFAAPLVQPTVHQATQTDLPSTKPEAKRQPKPKKRPGPLRKRQPTPPRPEPTRTMPSRRASHSTGYATTPAAPGTGRAWLEFDLKRLQQSVVRYGGATNMTKEDWANPAVGFTRKPGACRLRWEQMEREKRQERKQREWLGLS